MPEPTETETETELTTLEQIKELPEDSVIVSRMYFDEFVREWVFIKTPDGYWRSGTSSRLESSGFISQCLVHERIFLIYRGHEPTKAEIDAWMAI